MTPDARLDLTKTLVGSLRFADLDEETIKARIAMLTDSQAAKINALVSGYDHVTLATFSHVLCSLDAQVLTDQLEDIDTLIEAAFFFSDDAHKNYRPRGIRNEVKNVATVVSRVIELVPAAVRSEMGDDKRSALLKTVFSYPRGTGPLRHERSGPWTSHDVDSTLQEILPHMTIVSEEDGKRAGASLAGGDFRRNYVESFFWGSYPSSFSLYPDELLDRLYEFKNNSPEAFSSLMRVFSVKEVNADWLRSALHLIPMAPYVDDAEWGFILDSVEHYIDVPLTQDYSKQDHEVQQQCLALITVIAALPEPAESYAAPTGVFFGDEYGDEGADGAIWRFVDASVVSLIKENHSRAIDITRFVIERGVIDHETITECLNASSAPLSHGIL